jgi:putative N6-adenine-specific DNA methylase
LKRLGYENLSIENSRVVFKGDERDIIKTNLWLRTADRVLIRYGEFEALTFESLFEQTKALPWEDILPKNACFPVDGKSIKSTLFSVSDCQAIVKKAIVERLKSVYHQDWFDEDGPRYKIEVGLLKDIATITIDTSVRDYTSVDIEK